MLSKGGRVCALRYRTGEWVGSWHPPVWGCCEERSAAGLAMAGYEAGGLLWLLLNRWSDVGCGGGL